MGCAGHAPAGIDGADDRLAGEFVGVDVVTEILGEEGTIRLNQHQGKIEGAFVDRPGTLIAVQLVHAEFAQSAASLALLVGAELLAPHPLVKLYHVDVGVQLAHFAGIAGKIAVLPDTGDLAQRGQPLDHHLAAFHLLYQLPGIFLAQSLKAALALLNVPPGGCAGYQQGDGDAQQHQQRVQDVVDANAVVSSTH